MPAYPKTYNHSEKSRLTEVSRVLGLVDSTGQVVVWLADFVGGLITKSFGKQKGQY